MPLRPSLLVAVTVSVCSPVPDVSSGAGEAFPAASVQEAIPGPPSPSAQVNWALPSGWL